MQTTIYYFLQVVFCSAIMIGYYSLVLRNNKFHQYNRFYLLAIAALSWIVPLIKIHWNETSFSEDTNIYYLLSAVAENNTQLESSFKLSWYNISWQNGLKLLYIGGALLLLGSLMVSMFRIYQLYKSNKTSSLGQIDLVITNAKGTPYSFFKYIFWNEAIDITSTTGQQILQHEITHVKEKHSYDKLFVQLILIAGWFNPFFWLIKKELHMIHEFIADKKCVDSGDTASLAQMLLTAAYPQHQFSLTNSFFFSPIKRRIAMLSKQPTTKFSYLRRLIVLPLLAIIVVLVAFRNKETTQPISVESIINNIYKDIAGKSTPSVEPLDIDLEKDYTIVINAGHGGADKGGLGIDRKSTESILTLELANTIKSLNQNSRLNLVFTRNEDETQSVAEVAAIANKAKPDLFVSLHYNNANKNAQLSGTEIYIASPAKTNRYNSHLQFANELANQLDDLNMPFNGIKSRKEGVYVLQNINCPSILIEAGYLSNQKDLSKITSTNFRESLAVAILNGIQKYLADKENNVMLNDTTFPKTDSVKLAVKKIESVPGKQLFDSAQSISFSKGSDTWGTGLKLLAKNGQKPLVILNGKKIEFERLNEISPNEIESINVLKNEAAKLKYGTEGGNGVLEVFTKGANLKSVNPSHEKDGNDRSGIKSFMLRNKAVSNVSWNHQYKTMEIKLKDGTEEKYMLNNQSSMKRAEAKYGKLPIPAPPPPTSPSGRPVHVKEESYDKVFTKSEVPASFPGGKEAWQKYLERNLNRDLPVINGAPPGTYTVIVSFIVANDGGISSVKADNDPGYQTAAEAVRLIVKGPKWVPAKQNGKTVTSKVKQSITYMVSED
ncbi:N-acetylmuramoyl-L-alanine amidase [Sediminibacterium sp.]|uniref:N-acetylmuramoyl-L-alanine amidase n=1 Tax=Sediminibacterium sp. TaxID=1917865 RepID=UPI0027370EAB|nr:N-acetylmuramoyl-L-alanine amidase [Sediminibacterium sp.]MDP3392636.1 N-acetylmuramoyl-L-alanine amidase [Sediminibacterium sp.]MDP3566121.1 N-acetylmuramoyl-L-alanine amidase [Sediminibacterium sp.]